MLDLAPDQIPRPEVRQRLAAIEREHEVRVVYAVESGSRAWGFASRDSDVDARFLYVRHPAWYLSIRPGRDVIEPPIEGMFDVSGWDIKKALGLFAKSNPPLLEWLRSPLVYQETTGIAENMRALTPDFYSRRSCFYHYWSMARSNYRAELRGERVRPKKYFYVLRPILCCRWIEADPGAPPPMEFETLVERLLPAGDVRDAIGRLLEEKRAGAEGDRRPPIETLQRYIQQELADLETLASSMPPATPNHARLDTAFRDALREAWPGVPVP
ncbi:MAG: nucleotidyltransferase domain-containing protein [Bacteroidota bacterium]